MEQIKDDALLYDSAKKFIKEGLPSELDSMGGVEHVGILSLSRKGPRFQDVIFDSDNDINRYPTITEIALPFFFRKYHKTGKKIPQMMVFDDAVYFGTTIEGICKELEAYEKIYKSENEEQHVYVAIQTKESKFSEYDSSNRINIHSYNRTNGINIRDGYGHYFIKRLARDLRGLKTSLEVEYPIVKFECAGSINTEDFFNALRNEFSVDNTYKVTHDGGNTENYTVILKERQGMEFSKLRIYPDEGNNVIRIACMAPWMLPNNMMSIMSLFDNSPKLMRIWKELFDAYSYPAVEVKSLNVEALGTIERNSRKSLISLANYLLSYDTLLENKGRIEHVFRAARLSTEFKGVQHRDLFYLIGDDDLCEDIKSAFDDFWQEAKRIPAPYIDTDIKRVDYTVFEDSNYHDPAEKELFLQNNIKLLSKCQLYQEALSALCYNQTTLIEKWSRRNKEYNHRRLHFGYTFDTIFTYLLENRDKNGKKIEYFDTDTALHKSIHRCIDERVDHSCIVPQYILDCKTDNWIRVFRPGENEDAHLSHLARYVVFVLNTISIKLKLGRVDKSLLNKVLCFVLSKEEQLRKEQQDKTPTLKDDLGINLVVHEDLFCAEFKDADNKDNKIEKILDYLIDMDILSDKGDNTIGISDNLYDEDIRATTTLDKRVEDRIKGYVEDIALKFDAESISPQNSFFVMNYYFYRLNKSKTIADIDRFNKTAVDELRDAFENMGRNYQDKESYSNLIWDIYTGLKKYIISLGLLHASYLENEDYAKRQIKLWQMKTICELIITAYLANNLTLFRNMISDNGGIIEINNIYIYLDPATRDALQKILDEYSDERDIRKYCYPEIRNFCDKMIDNITSL